MQHKSRVLFSADKLTSFLIIVDLFLLGIVAVYLLKPSYIVNIFIVYLPALLYCLYLAKNSRKKIMLFSLLSLLFIIPVEILARVTDSWDVLSTFPRIFGIAPIENVVYALVNIALPIAFYEYFYDNDRNPEISKNARYLILLFFVFAVMVVSTFLLNPVALQLDYWLIGLCIYLPIFVLLLIFKSHIVKRLIVVAILFGLMYLIHEALSMYLGHWWWPGEYLLPVNILGHVYPIEDFIIWILFSNVAVIAGYEVMWD